MYLLPNVHTIRLSVREAQNARQVWLVEHGDETLHVPTLFEASQLACELAILHWKQSGEPTQLLIRNGGEESWHPLMRLGPDRLSHIPRVAANSCD
jgi:hypothetical protein